MQTHGLPMVEFAFLALVPDTKVLGLKPVIDLLTVGMVAFKSRVGQSG